MLASQTTKHWPRGYISGSFDMFHIGHLNLIRRAKERCGHLIVGVLTDELVAASKQRWPVIPFEQRLAIVAALKYVDETDVTTQPLLDKLAAWEKYRFDAMFSGDDHLHDEWLLTSEEEALRALGADLVFFPYTKEVSSTELQERTLPPKAEGADKARKVEDGFRHLFPFDKVNKGERIIIYGVGDVGEQYFKQLSALGFCHIAAFADTYAKEGDAFQGIRCVRPEDIAGCEGQYDRIVVASTRYYSQIIGKLRVLGIPAGRIV